MPGKIGKLQTMPFTNKLIISILLLILLTDGTIGYFAYRLSMDSTREYVESDMNKTLSHIRDHSLYQLRDFQKVSDELFENVYFQRLLQTQWNDYRVYDDTVNKLVPLLNAAQKRSIHPFSLKLYVTNDRINEIYTVPDPNDPLLGRSSVNLYHMSRLENRDLYAGWNDARLDNVWVQLGNDASYSQISLFRKLVSFDDWSTIGYLRITSRLQDIFQSIESFEIYGYKTTVLVADRDNHILYSNNETEAQQLWQSDMTNHVVYEQTVTGTDWRLVAFVPKAVLKKDYYKIRNLIIAVCLVSFLALAFIAYTVSKPLRNRVAVIVRSIEAFQRGEMHRRIYMKRKDEFSLISDSFNTMAANIQQLIGQIRKTTKEKKEAEMQALQAQINPHFLYNTLSSVVSLANMGEIDKLSDMVSSLVKFYRLTLHNGDFIIDLYKEIEHVMSYIQVQKIKYRERLEASCEISPDILRYPTIKLILQPLVENVIKHAWFDERIHIRIVGYREGEDIVLKVIDNGVGMSADRIRAVLHAEDGTIGYGIRNIDRRLKLYYGEGYRVSIYSRPGIGCCVQLKFHTRGPITGEERYE